MSEPVHIVQEILVYSDGSRKVVNFSLDGERTPVDASEEIVENVSKAVEESPVEAPVEEAVEAPVEETPASEEAQS